MYVRGLTACKLDNQPGALKAANPKKMLGPGLPQVGPRLVGRELQGEVETLLHYARMFGSVFPELPRLLARVTRGSVLPTLLEMGPESQTSHARVMLPWTLYEVCLALSEPLSTVCAKADWDAPDQGEFARATAILLALQCRDASISRNCF